jgi:hypothetical protein
MTLGALGVDAEGHLGRIEARADISAEPHDSANHDAAVIGGNGGLADVDNRKRGVPMAKRIAAKNIRTDQIVKREIVRQFVIPEARNDPSGVGVLGSLPKSTALKNQFKMKQFGLCEKCPALSSPQAPSRGV